MAVLFVGWLAYFLVAGIRFRKSANPRPTTLEAGLIFRPTLKSALRPLRCFCYQFAGSAVGQGGGTSSRWPPGIATDPIEIPDHGPAVRLERALCRHRWKWGKQDIKFAEKSFGLDADDPNAKDDVTCLRTVLPARQSRCHLPHLLHGCHTTVSNFRWMHRGLCSLRVAMSIPVHFDTDFTSRRVSMVITAPSCAGKSVPA